MLLPIMKGPTCFDRFLTVPVMNPREITHLERKSWEAFRVFYRLHVKI